MEYTESQHDREPNAGEAIPYEEYSVVSATTEEEGDEKDMAPNSARGAQANDILVNDAAAAVAVEAVAVAVVYFHRRMIAPVMEEKRDRHQYQKPKRKRGKGLVHKCKRTTTNTS